MKNCVMNNWYTKYANNRQVEPLVTSNSNGSKDWYGIYHNAGIKDLAGALLTAVIMVSSGVPIEEAAAKNNVAVEEVEQAVEEQKQSYSMHPVTPEVVQTVRDLEGASRTTVGPSEDTGVMQVIPTTWEEMNQKYFQGKFPYDQYKFNETVQVAIGRQYLIHLQKWLQSHRDEWGANGLFLMLAAYNGGMGTLNKADFDPEKLKEINYTAYDYATRGCNLLGEPIQP